MVTIWARMLVYQGTPKLIWGTHATERCLLWVEPGSFCCLTHSALYPPIYSKWGSFDPRLVFVHWQKIECLNCRFKSLTISTNFLSYYELGLSFSEVESWPAGIQQSVQLFKKLFIYFLRWSKTASFLVAVTAIIFFLFRWFVKFSEFYMLGY